MLDVRWNPPPLAGRDLSDPQQLVELLGERDAALRTLTDEIANRANDPKRILPDGATPLSRSSTEGGLWEHCVVHVNATLSEARRDGRASGFKIADGSNRTADLRGRFLRGAANGANAGETGGCGSFTGASVSETTHYHGGCYPSDTVSGCPYDPCTDLYGAIIGHEHDALDPEDNNRSSSNGNHGHGLTVTSDALPPYYDAVACEKMS
jgi:hypothetical protein